MRVGWLPLSDTKLVAKNKGVIPEHLLAIRVDERIRRRCSDRFEIVCDNGERGGLSPRSTAVLPLQPASPVRMRGI